MKCFVCFVLFCFVLVKVLVGKLLVEFKCSVCLGIRRVKFCLNQWYELDCLANVTIFAIKFVDTSGIKMTRLIPLYDFFFFFFNLCFHSSEKIKSIVIRVVENKFDTSFFLMFVLIFVRKQRDEEILSGYRYI